MIRVPAPRAFRLGKSTVLVLGAVLLHTVGCAKPPVEDIASAEAALQAAREAEAEKFAPQPYGEAENLMTETYRLNDNKDYENTKIRAGETRDKAEEARDLALRNRAEKSQLQEEMDTEGGDNGDGGRIEGNTPDETQAEIASEEIGAGAMDDGSRLKSLESVQFGFDEYGVNAEEMPKVEAVADWLNQNPTATLKIEGHTDERGAGDYNLSLGARRADSVRQVLSTLGIDDARITTQSYGEEAPVDPGHTSEAWARNRRADFVINP